jgi:predicted RNA binding protein YcfA (HicA-like mRNA interferase family)
MSRSIIRGIRPKEVQVMVRDLLREGWTVSTTGSNHVKVTHPNGRSVVTALTGSGGKQALRSFARNVRNVKEGRPTS